MTDDRPVDILVVDDDEDCLLFVRETIEDVARGTVHEVTSGAEALEFLHRRGTHADAPAVGLVYLDVEMPEMNGQDVLKALRAEARFAELPVVMMTAVRDDREMALAARNGANSYVVKPHDATAFAETIVATTKYWLEIHARPTKRSESGDGS